MAMIQIHALPAFSDNYIWLLQDPQQHRCAVVDPGDASPVLDWLAAHPGWQLSDILLTHHHPDHTGGVARLKAATAARVLGPALETIAGCDLPLQDGAQIRVLDCDWQIMHLPGHTLGHIAFYHADPQQPLLFCGDTLFAAGCGRLFEGTPEQMFNSLQRLAALPEQTGVYCTHEYTLSNLHFARAVEPDNPCIRQRLQEVAALREQQRITLPSSIGLEKRSNPFLRSAEPAVNALAAARLGKQQCSALEAFAELRRWKDVFRA
jgi:hydroxyacylglutathione hydrolase